MAESRERVLIVVTPTVSDDELATEVSGAQLGSADVRLVVPAVTKSALSFWFSDDRAMKSARSTAAQFRERIEGSAGHVVAAAGDCDPALAVEDAIASFHPDRIIVVHRDDHPGYRENRLDAESLERRLRRPVEEHLISA